MANHGNTFVELELIHLPTELLLQIFDYLPPRLLYFSVRMVCKRFCDLLMDDMYFKKRFKKMCTHKENSPFLKAYGLVENTSETQKDFTWTDISVRTDLREVICKQSDALKFYTMSDPHTATVDTVKLLGNGRLCVTGGRDKLLCLWDVEALSKPLFSKTEAHTGWIWDVTGHEEDDFFTCGWETTIKEWSAGRGLLECTRQFRTERPAMRLASKPGLLLAGLHTGKVILIDPRSKETDGQSSYKAHRGTITGLKLWDKTILSVGEDRRMVAYDLRKSAKIFQGDFRSPSCTRSSAVFGGLWYLGDNKGSVSVYEIANLKDTLFFASICNQYAVNTIYSSLEGIIAGTSDGRIMFLSTVRPFEVQKEILFSGEITSIDCRKNIIAAGSSDCSSCFHILKTNYNVFT